MRTNNETNQIRLDNAAIGCARVNKPPMIATIPIPISVTLVPFEAAPWKNPFSGVEITTTSRDVPRNVRKNH
jgi:hypothetical protein